jgi:hypothetical protein
MRIADLMSLQAWDTNGLCPLHVAIMLTKSNKTNPDGASTVLDASNASYFILDSLLRHSNADPNVRTEAGYTPAMVATCLMIPQALRMLLQYKADIRSHSI